MKTAINKEIGEFKLDEKTASSAIPWMTSKNADSRLDGLTRNTNILQHPVAT